MTRQRAALLLKSEPPFAEMRAPGSIPKHPRSVDELVALSGVRTMSRTHTLAEACETPTMAAISLIERPSKRRSSRALDLSCVFIFEN